MTDTNKRIEDAYEIIQLTPEKALKQFDEILQIEPDNIMAINGKASAYMKLNNIDEADNLFDRSISINPTTTAYINKGLIAKQRKEYEEALKYYNKVNEINPRMNNITCIMKNEVFDSLDLDDEDDKLEIFSNEINLLIKKGLNYKRLNKYWDSLDCYEMAIQKDKTCTEYIDSLIYEINIKIENQFLFNRPHYDDSQISQLRIRGLQKLLLEANPNEAITYFNRVLKIDPDDIDTLNYKAIILFNQEKYEESINYFDKCLSLDEDYYYALFNKSLVLIRTKKFNEASACFEKLLDNPESYNIAKRYNIDDIKKINIITLIN